MSGFQFPCGPCVAVGVVAQASHPRSGDVVGRLRCRAGWWASPARTAVGAGDEGVNLQAEWHGCVG